MERPVPAPVQAVSSFSDPFAPHTPKHVAPTPLRTGASAEVVEVAHAASAGAAASAPAAADPFAGLSAEDADTHRKAQRFARLLVDEIKLYNQAKVAEGRRNKDFYDRLKEDIDKSRYDISEALRLRRSPRLAIIFRRKSFAAWRRTIFR